MRAGASGLALSIVSHGHGEQVLALLDQLRQRAEPCLRRIIITVNIPEPALHLQRTGYEWTGVSLELRHNARPQGFSRNHNAALAGVADDLAISHVCVLNPDIQLIDAAPLQALIDALQAPQAALAYPRLVNADGTLQDNERALPTPVSLLRRRLQHRRETRIDWVSGACMALRAHDWRQLGGFDEGFHMYCEDVDLSLRARRDIGALVRADTTMVHLAQRASHRSMTHLRWHMQSLLRLWRLPSYRWARAHPMIQSDAPSL